MNFPLSISPWGGGGGTPLCDLNGDVQPDKVWFSGCFVLNGVSISSLCVLRTVPTIVTAHTLCASRDTRVSYGWCLLIQG